MLEVRTLSGDTPSSVDRSIGRGPLTLAAALFTLAVLAPYASAQTISPSSAEISVSETVTLTAYWKHSGNVMYSARWSSNDASVATVSSSGVVTGMAEGTALITASAKGQKVTATITVVSGGSGGGGGGGGGGTGSSRYYIWVSPEELASRSTSGTAWSNLEKMASSTCATPALDDQDDKANTCVLAKAIVFARTGSSSLRTEVATAIQSVIILNQTYSGRALALGRELAAYIIAADLIDLPAYDGSLDSEFRSALRYLRTAYTDDGPDNLVECHEKRPNNWGTHCGASRAAIAAYLKDAAEMDRVATVFRGWLGDRGSYAGFSYGDLSWQCSSSSPVGINPKGCTRDGNSIDGVLADDQRRGGSYTWPPPGENYVYEALQGAIVQAVILKRAGYDVFNWSDQALLRAYEWLHTVAGFPAEGDDTWQPHLVNYYYGTAFPAPTASSPGKNMGWTDWTHGR